MTHTPEEIVAMSDIIDKHYPNSDYVSYSDIRAMMFEYAASLNRQGWTRVEEMKWVKAKADAVIKDIDMKHWRLAETKEPITWQLARRKLLSENYHNEIEYLDEDDDKLGNEDPFGEEWEKEMNKMPKQVLINWLRKFFKGSESKLNI